MGAQTNSRLFGLLLVALSLVLLLAPLDSAARKRQSGRRSDSVVHYQDDPENPKWEEPDNPDRQPGERLFGPFWPGCGRLRAYQPNGWPDKWPLRDDNFHKPLKLVKGNFKSRQQQQQQQQQQQRRHGHSRIAHSGNRVTNATEFPSHVTILDKQYGRWAGRCAGVLIADRLVLTSRRCVSWAVSTNDMSMLKVFASWRTVQPFLPFEVDWEADGKMREVENLCLSGQAAQMPDDQWDVQWAIIRTKEPFCFSDTVYPACLPRQPYWDPEELVQDEEKNETMIVQVGGNNYDHKFNMGKYYEAHLRAYIHRNIFKCQDENDKLEVCAAISVPTNTSWDPMCWRDAGAGGYILDKETLDSRLVVASIVGHMPVKSEIYANCTIVDKKEDAIFKSLDVHEALEVGKLKEAIELCSQGLYGYPKKFMFPVMYT